MAKLSATKTINPIYYKVQSLLNKISECNVMNVKNVILGFYTNVINDAYIPIEKQHSPPVYET